MYTNVITRFVFLVGGIMRKFEKISFEQFKKDVADDITLYKNYLLPERKTKNSAGYDFYLLTDITINPNEILKIPTGVKVTMNSDEMLMIIIRSGIGFKYNVRLTNQVGIIESDYYNNVSNEGHMWISIQNHSDKKITFKKSSSLCQGIFVKFLTVDNEREIFNTRIGGFGSTDK